MTRLKRLSSSSRSYLQIKRIYSYENIFLFPPLELLLVFKFAHECYEYLHTYICFTVCVYGLASSFFFRESFSTQGKDGCQLLQKYFLPSCQAATLPKSHCCGCSVIKSCLTLCDPGTAALQAFLSLAISWSFIKVMSTELVMPSNHLIPCHPLLLLPSFFPSIIEPQSAPGLVFVDCIELLHL